MARKKAKIGDIRWNANKGFYQIYTMHMTWLGFPVPLWAKARNQKKAKSAMGEGYTNMVAYNKDARKGKAGKKAPHKNRRPPKQIKELEATLPDINLGKIDLMMAAIQDKKAAPIVLDIPDAEAAPELPKLAVALNQGKIQPESGLSDLLQPETAMFDPDLKPCPEACPCRGGTEHAYERPCNIETGLRPIYRTTLALPALGAGVLTLEVNDPGSIDRIWLGAADIATGAILDAAVTITGQIQLNSINWDFAKTPGSTLRPFNELTDNGLGMKMGRLDMIKTDEVEVPLLNNSAVAVLVEIVMSLWGPCAKHHLKVPTRAK